MKTKLVFSPARFICSLVALAAFLFAPSVESGIAILVASFVAFALTAGSRPGYSMACSPFDAMKTQTESLANDLLRKASPNSLWMNAVPKKMFKKHAGITQTKFVIQNSEPTSDNETWADITLTGDQITLDDTEGTSNCDITYNQVNVGFEEFTYGPKKFGLKGPVICEDNLTFHHDAASFLLAYEQELRKRAKRSWEFEMRRQYMFFAEKYGDGDLIGEASTAISAIPGAAIPESQLVPDALDAVATALLEQEATEPDSNGYVTMGDTGHIFTLYIGIEAANRLQRLDADRRIDIRYAKPSDLMRAVGATYAWGNFRHAITSIPPRFDVVGGVLTQRNTFEMVATTQGYKARRTTAWKNAEYEAAIVVLPSVFDAEVVEPMTGAGGVQFKPQNYFGEWDFITGAYRLGLDCDDPKDKPGQHLAEFQYAPAPNFPHFGKVVLFKRCPQDRTLAYCS